MTALDLARFRDTPLSKDPFDYLILPGFLKTDALDAISRDYPKVEQPGSFPVSSVEAGPAFTAMLAELQGPEMTKAFAEKFGMDLTGKPTMVTVRGKCRARDGKIHVDSEDKLITVLIYMNDNWEGTGGRLRVLRGPDDIEDMVEEVPPVAGTLLCFRNGPTAWHGHKSHEGARRVIQLNWVTGQDVVWREQKRHGFSAFMKKIKAKLGFYK